MSILNICDYKDEKENIYYKELQKCFGVNADINSVVFEKGKNPAELLMQLMTERYDLIVGHGFGGVLALYIGRATNVKTPHRRRLSSPTSSVCAASRWLLWYVLPASS